MEDNTSEQLNVHIEISISEVELLCTTRCPDILGFKPLPLLVNKDSSKSLENMAFNFLYFNKIQRREIKYSEWLNPVTSMHLPGMYFLEYPNTLRFIIPKHLIQIYLNSETKDLMKIVNMLRICRKEKAIKDEYQIILLILKKHLQLVSSSDHDYNYRIRIPILLHFCSNEQILQKYINSSSIKPFQTTILINLIEEGYFQHCYYFLFDILKHTNIFTILNNLFLHKYQSKHIDLFFLLPHDQFVSKYSFYKELASKHLNKNMSFLHNIVYYNFEYLSDWTLVVSFVEELIISYVLKYGSLRLVNDLEQSKKLFNRRLLLQFNRQTNVIILRDCLNNNATTTAKLNFILLYYSELGYNNRNEILEEVFQQQSNTLQIRVIRIIFSKFMMSITSEIRNRMISDDEYRLFYIDLKNLADSELYMYLLIKFQLQIKNVIPRSDYLKFFDGKYLDIHSKDNPTRLVDCFRHFFDFKVRKVDKYSPMLHYILEKFIKSDVIDIEHCVISTHFFLILIRFINLNYSM